MELFYKNGNEYIVCDGRHDADIIVLSMSEYDDMMRQLMELKRINKEKSNAERGITPKKQRSGYVLLSYDTSPFRLNAGKEVLEAPTRRLLFETPYSVEMFYREAYSAVRDDFIRLAGKLGADDLEEKRNIKRNEFIRIFGNNAKNTVILCGLELQRNQMWAARLHANFTPRIDRDFIKKQDKNKQEAAL